MLYVGDVIRLFGEAHYYRIVEVSGGGRISDALTLSDGRVVSELSVEAVRELSDEMPKLSDDEIDAKLSAVEKAMFGELSDLEDAEAWDNFGPYAGQ